MSQQRVTLQQDANDLTRREYPFDYSLEVTHAPESSSFNGKV